MLWSSSWLEMMRLPWAPKNVSSSKCRRTWPGRLG